MAMLVTGGARSGKSHFAEQLAMRKYKQGIYIATSEALDGEMAERINKHQEDRRISLFPWTTIEAPLHLADELNKLARLDKAKMKDNVVLVDCLTLWLSNWFFHLDAEHTGTTQLRHEMELLQEAIEQYPHPLILVTNELGDGIVPMDKLSRMYRDEAGRLNQLIASSCDQVFLVTAGIPVELKKLAFQWEEL